MTQLATVLVVEDDPAVHELVRFTLDDAGYNVMAALSGEEAVDRLNDVVPDIALIDWMLPGMSGLALAEAIRTKAQTKSVPIIMLTARAAEADRVAGLEAGADDYITKPFSPRELTARVRAVLRRRGTVRAAEALEVGPLKLDPRSHNATLNGSELSMGPTEYRLLKFLMTNPGRVFTRGQLLSKVWGDHALIEERTVDVHMRRLRVALGPSGEKLLETVRGVGYKLERDVDS